MTKKANTGAESAETKENTYGQNTYPEITEAQIKDWKAKHGRVFRLRATKKDGSAIYDCYFRKPNIVDIQRAKASEAKKPFTGSESLFNNCKLYVPDAVVNDDELLLGIYGELGEMITIAEVDVKEV